MASTLEQGAALSAVWGPLSADGQQAGATIEWKVVQSITVSCLSGPLGYYDVAVICYNNGAKASIMPLHMAETIEVLP